jgi:hypothetical protein
MAAVAFKLRDDRRCQKFSYRQESDADSFRLANEVAAEKPLKTSGILGFLEQISACGVVIWAGPKVATRLLKRPRERACR